MGVDAIENNEIMMCIHRGVKYCYCTVPPLSLLQIDGC